MRKHLWTILLAAALTLWSILILKAGLTAPAEKAYYRYINAFIVSGLAFAIWLRVLSSQPEKPGNPSAKAWGLLLFLALALAAFSYVAGMRQFAGFDHSALIDPAWRMINGQQPYTDFPCPLPVGFYLSAFHAFQLGGVAWSSLVLLNSVFAAVTFLWLAALLANLSGPGWRAWLLALCIQACTTLLVGYWWYNSVTTVVGCVFLLSSVFWTRAPGSRFAWLSWGGSLLLFAACKPNIAGPLIIGATLILFCDRVLRWRVLSTAFIALIAFAGILAAHGITLTEMLGGYLSVASRGLSWNQFLQDLDLLEKIRSLTVLGLILLPVFAFIPRGGKLSRSQGLALLAIACGLYGFVTNGESKLVDLPLILLAVILWIRDTANRPESFPLQKKIASHVLGLQEVVIIVLIVIGTGLGWMRHRVFLAGPGTFFEYSNLGRVDNNAFFAGLKAPPGFRTTLTETTEAVRLHPDGRIFFGPRMQWAYAAMSLPPPANQPSWWHPGVAYKAEDEPRYLINWQKADHNVLIFLKNDHTYLSSDFVRDLNDRYTEEAHACISVYTLKSRPASHKSISAPATPASSSSVHP